MLSREKKMSHRDIVLKYQPKILLECGAFRKFNILPEGLHNPRPITKVNDSGDDLLSEG
jgi:hypothetical protein